jgi:thiol-disulfide isomerase/thioredoxin
MTHPSFRNQFRGGPKVQHRRILFPLFASLLVLPACNVSSPSSGDRGRSATTPATKAKPKQLPKEEIAIGKKAIEIVGTTVEGERLRLSDFKGKVVLIDVWATWCGPCVAAIPHEKKLVERFKGRPFTILGISGDRTRDDLQSFLNKNKLPWPNIHDGTGEIRRNWQIEAYPTFAVVDHHGIVAGYWVGSNHMDAVDQAIERTVTDAEKGTENAGAPTP